ncbi:MAG TPA: hypothetical protein ENH46_04845, partial [Candidatus Pacearchaeota archaeon]|nr:hypothetical protein [Candidatus Pacearchaeota archaeon]
MGFFDSDSERGKKDGEEYKKKIERGEAGFIDLLDEIAGGVSPVTPPEYRKAYDEAMSKSYGETPSSRESEVIEDSSQNSDYGSSSSDDDSDDSYYPDSSSSVDI